MLRPLPWEQMATEREIAEQMRIPQPLLAKVLQKLAGKRIVRSVQGAHGGYVLQDCLDSLTLADMVELLEGPIHLTECRTERASCKRMGKCDLRHRIELVQQSLTDVFSRIKVTDLFLSAVGKGTQRHRCCATLEQELNKQGGAIEESRFLTRN